MSEQPPMDEAAQKALALNLFLDAWEAALAQGVEPEVLASVAIYSALADLVDAHGEEAIAELCADLPRRVRAGEFTLAEEDEPEN